jgi:hypothetical protein
MGCSSRSGFEFLPITDPGVKKAPDPQHGSMFHFFTVDCVCCIPVCPTESTHRMVAAGSFLQLLKLEKRGLATTLQAAMYADIAITVGEPADHEVGKNQSCGSDFSP